MKQRKLLRESINKKYLKYLTNIKKEAQAIQMLKENPGFFYNLCLKSLGTVKKNHPNRMIIENWCSKVFGKKLGSGAYRTAFDFGHGKNKELVIKIAFDMDEGIFTNEKEIKEFMRLGNKFKIFPRLYAADTQNYEWLVVEKVDIPHNIEDRLNIAIKDDFPDIFGDFPGWLRSILPAQFKSNAHIDVLLDVIKYDWNKIYNIYGIKESMVEYYWFFSYLASYKNEDIFENFVLSVMSSDVEGLFETSGRENDYFDLVNLIFENISKDQEMIRMAHTFYTIGIDMTDLGPGNLGVSAIDGSMKIIDISIFK